MTLAAALAMPEQGAEPTATRRAEAGRTAPVAGRSDSRTGPSVSAILPGRGLVRRLASRAARRPWMSVAVLLSVAVPLGIALMPPGMGGDSTVDAVLDEIPIPGIIEFHGDDPAPISTADGPALSTPDLGTPAPVDNPWNSTPAATANGNGTRLAHFRDDVEPPGAIQEVGNNRPAVVRSRGAWLTGTIEDAPTPDRPPTRSQAPRF